MTSINGTAMHKTQRDTNRHAAGCPSIPGGWSLGVAKYRRDFGTEPTP
jgi:hypothetical protein